jgi:hypothetical protein
MSSTSVVYVISFACNAAGNCVEAGLRPTGDVAIRDTKDREKAPQIYTPEEWDAFVQGVKAGQFDRASMPSPTSVTG